MSGKFSDKDAMRFVDAVALAREFHKANSHIVARHPINVNPDIKEAVILRAKEYSDNFENLENLEILELATETTKLSGFIMIRTGSPVNLLSTSSSVPQILFSKTLSKCWKRFTVCKELMHIYIDVAFPLGEQDEVKQGEVKQGELDLDEFVKRMESVSRDFWRLQKEDDLDAEWFCVFAAIEVLLPWEKREILHKMKEEGRTHYHIARDFKVPEAVIDMYFTGGLKELSVECNEGL